MIRESMWTEIICDSKHCDRGTSRAGLVDIRATAKYIGWTRDGDRDLCPRCSSQAEATPQGGE